MTALCCCVLLSLVAMWTDVKHREVPHWIIGALVSLWVLTATVAPEALNGEPLMGIACGAAAFIVGFFLHALGWLGGGDGKLLAALAMWLGPTDLGLALLATGLFGLFLALPALLRFSTLFKERGVPYACAVAPPAATILAFRALIG
ncbi:MAG: prepilin peptidase [Gammaproteobacteria bacterium]|nr:prepilin peptidase [Gammaproteobacteria bacterium]MDE0225713.1 prepilin peptidase [Gammaproteobacteria bacterium]MDE0452240.1 prepilin peptidase [Gammaproteobacteria bacterium]